MPLLVGLSGGWHLQPMKNCTTHMTSSKKNLKLKKKDLGLSNSLERVSASVPQHVVKFWIVQSSDATNALSKTNVFADEESSMPVLVAKQITSLY